MEESDINKRDEIDEDYGLLSTNCECDQNILLSRLCTSS